MRHLILLACCSFPILLSAQPAKPAQPAIPDRLFDPAQKNYHQAPLIALPEISLNKTMPAAGVPQAGGLRLQMDEWMAKPVAPDNMPCFVPDLNRIARMPNSSDDRMVLPYIPNAIPVKPKAVK